jgi:release factor glutamine methyltransferase
VVINPPYFRKDPADDGERAWFAGANFEYFAALFAQLPMHTHAGSDVFMILGEDCEVAAVIERATAANLDLRLWRDGVLWLERQLIFSIHPSRSASSRN